MKNYGLLKDNIVADVRPENELGEWKDNAEVISLPFYAGLDWIYKDGTWFQPSGHPPTSDQLAYIVRADTFIDRLTDEQALKLWQLANTDGRVSRMLLRLSSLTQGIYSNDPLTLGAIALSDAVFGPEESRRLFDLPTDDEQAKSARVLDKTPTTERIEL